MIKRLEPYLAQAEQRWQQLPARDRRALSWLLLLLPVLLVALFWWPSFAAREQAQRSAQQAEGLLMQLRQEAPRLRQSGTATKPSLAEMPTRLQQLALAQGLTVDRIEPDNTGVKLQLSAVILVSLTRFLEQSRQQGMPVEELQITRDGESFRAQLRFAG